MGAKSKEMARVIMADEKQEGVRRRPCWQRTVAAAESAGLIRDQFGLSDSDVTFGSAVPLFVYAFRVCIFVKVSRGLYSVDEIIGSLLGRIADFAKA